MKKVPIYSFILFILILLIWEGLAKQMSELVLPAPFVIVNTLLEGLKSGYYTPHIIRTSLEIIIGLFLGSLLGMLTGILMGEVEFIRKLLFPYVIASQAVPKLALAPLFIPLVWFWNDIKSRDYSINMFFPVNGKYSDRHSIH